MIKKTYIPAKPRNEKLIGTGGGGISSSMSGALANSHTHSNKSVIDQLTQADINVLEKLSLVDGNLRIDANAYSTGDLSAFGFEEGQEGGVIINVIDSLTSTSKTDPLSANMGRYLKTLIDNIEVGEGGQVLVDWEAITGKPDTFAPSAHDHIIGDVTGLQDALDDKASLSQLDDKEDKFTKNTAFNKNFGTGVNDVARGNHTHEFASLTSIPTTLSGYGITDAYTKTNVDDLLSNKADKATKITAGTGLTGGGTLASDRTLSVNFGTTAGTVTQGNDSRLSDARTPLAHSHAISDITNLQTTLNNKLETSIFNTHNTDNVRHITGAERTKWDGVVTDFAELEIGGRNLFSKVHSLRGDWYNNNGTTVRSEGDSFAIAIKVYKGGDYTINFNNSIPLRRVWFIKDETILGAQSFEWVNDVNLPHIINVSDDATYIMVQGSTSLSDELIASLKIEKGNKATDWTPAPEDVQASIDLKLNKLTFDDLFEKVEISTGKWAVKVKYNLFSVGEISAFGAEESEGGGGIVNILSQWANYDTSKSGWALSAGLGVDLNTRKADKIWVESLLENYTPTDTTYTAGRGLTLEGTQFSTSFDIASYATVTALGNKVDKVTGKSLISDTEITRLSSVTNQDLSPYALKTYVDTEVGKKWTYSESTIKAVKVSNAFNSDTVNGFTVGVDVPDNAKFTDTIVDISGKADKTTLTAHTGNTSNPHSVTKKQVGLEYADNTSDLLKPISTATQTALNTKVSKSGDTMSGALNIISEIASGSRLNIKRIGSNYNAVVSFENSSGILTIGRTTDVFVVGEGDIYSEANRWLTVSRTGVTTPKVTFGNGWTAEGVGAELQFKLNGVIQAKIVNGALVSMGEVTAHQ